MGHENQELLRLVMAMAEDMGDFANSAEASLKVECGRTAHDALTLVFPLLPSKNPSLALSVAAGSRYNEKYVYRIYLRSIRQSVNNNECKQLRPLRQQT